MENQPIDITIALLDAWSSIADILSYYQERIATEGFLPTAREPRPVKLTEFLIPFKIAKDSNPGPLQSLLSIIAEQVTTLENDIELLYKNWFSESNDEWVVPYIGGMVVTLFPPHIGGCLLQKILDTFNTTLP